MTPILVDVKESLRALVETVVGVSAQWDKAPRQMTSEITQALCLLSVTSLVPIGRDEEIQKPNPSHSLHLPPGSDLITVLLCNRYMVVSIKVESADLTAGASSLDYLEFLRTQFALPSVRAALHACGLALTSTGTLVDLSEARDDHQVSIWTLDFTFFLRYAMVDPVAYPYISTPQFIGTIHQPGYPVVVPGGLPGLSIP